MYFDKIKFIVQYKGVFKLFDTIQSFTTYNYTHLLDYTKSMNTI